MNVHTSRSPCTISPLCSAPLVSGPPSSPAETVIGPGECAIVNRYVPLPSTPLSALATQMTYVPADGATASIRAASAPD